MAWIAPVVAAVVALPAVIVGRRSWGIALIGAGLMALTAHLAVHTHDVVDALWAAEDPEAWPRYDLRQGGLPSRPPTYVAVQGHLRRGLVLDEYAVAEGERPDQNERADAALVPLLGSVGEVQTLDGPIVVARVAKGTEIRDDIVTLMGKIEPLPDELLATLVQIAPEVAPAEVRGVLLNTLSVPTSREAWTNFALVLLAGMFGVSCLWIATSPPK